MSTTTNAPVAEGSSPAIDAVIPAPAAPAIVDPPIADNGVSPTEPLGSVDTVKEMAAKLTPALRQQIATGKFKIDKPVVAPAEPAVATDKGTDLPDRFRFAAEDDKMVALLAKREGISLIEAGRRVDSLRNPASPAPAAAPVVQPAPAPAAPLPDANVVRHDARLSEIDVEAAKLMDEANKFSEDMDHAKANAVLRKVAQLDNEKARLETDQRQSADRSAQSYEQAIHASRDRAYTQFAELGDPTSQHHVGLIGYVTMEQGKPERQAFFGRPDYPELIAQEYAQKFGIKTGAAKPPVSATPAPKPAFVTKSKPSQVPPSTSADGRLLTSAAGSTPAPRAMTTAEMILASRSDPKLRNALRQAVMRPAHVS